MAGDIMSCSPTLECDKFGDYFCLTYVENTIFPLSLWAQVPAVARRRPTNNRAASFHRHFNAQFTSPHEHTFLIFWDEIVKQQTVTHITVDDLNTIAPVTVERKRQQRLL